MSETYTELVHRRMWQNAVADGSTELSLDAWKSQNIKQWTVCVERRTSRFVDFHVEAITADEAADMAKDLAEDSGLYVDTDFDHEYFVGNVSQKPQ